MLKLSPTQKKILENAAGIRIHYPKNRSEAGGWSGASLVCRRNGWIDDRGKITDAGRAAIGLTPAPIEGEDVDG